MRLRCSTLLASFTFIAGALLAAETMAQGPGANWGGVRNFVAHSNAASFNNFQALHHRHHHESNANVPFPYYVAPPYVVPQIAEYQAPPLKCTFAVDQKGNLVYYNALSVMTC